MIFLRERPRFQFVLKWGGPLQILNFFPKTCSTTIRTSPAAQIAACTPKDCSVPLAEAHVTCYNTIISAIRNNLDVRSRQLGIYLKVGDDEASSGS
jgi:hypothetical protein